MMALGIRSGDEVITTPFSLIPTAVHYPIPLNRQPALAQDVSIPVSDRLSHKVLSLPMHPFLTPEDQDKIIEIFAK